MVVRGTVSWLLVGSSFLTQANGQFGGQGYEPPAPVCKPFKCSAGQVAAGKTDNKIWSYGCKESGMNVMNMASLDPNNPYANQGGQKNLNKCCVDRDICKQTCGMTSKACHDNFQKCSKKICKGDQNCQLQAMMADIMTEPYDADEAKFDKDKKYDPEESKCKAYHKGQNASCECVPKDDFKASTESKLKAFYANFNPEKLDDMGDIKDVADVWKKWTGKEADMFMALATKYKEKSVEMRVKPKPPPYKPPPKMDGEDGTDADSADDSWTAPPSEEPAKPAEKADPEEAAFKEKRAALLTKKRVAKEEEEYDLAGEAKEELEQLVKAELDRLNAKKKQAIEDEDYKEAKRIKNRLEKLAEL